jgi:hypothetical protein
MTTQKTEAIKERLREIEKSNQFARAWLRYIERADDQDAAVAEIERGIFTCVRKLGEIVLEARRSAERACASPAFRRLAAIAAAHQRRGGG